MVNKINTKLRTHLGQHECMLQSEGYLNFTEIQKFISDQKHFSSTNKDNVELYNNRIIEILKSSNSGFNVTY